MDLLAFRKNVTSQYGEDGILEKIFDVLSISRGLCVEFGAWDGKKFSNSYNLIANMGWGGVLIEGSAQKFPELQETYKGRADVTLLNRLVGFDAPERLDDILSQTTLPLDFDMLSIDVDGNDYHILDSITTYHPKVLIVEYNPSVPNHLAIVQERKPSVNHGSSLKAITDLATRKGYSLVCVTDTNGIYVAQRYFSLFGINDNSLDTLHSDKRYQTYLIQLYDGTLHVAGMDKMIWHGIKIESSRIQVLPAELRRFPDSIG
jgi:hypothetical protein